MEIKVAFILLQRKLLPQAAVCITIILLPLWTEAATNEILENRWQIYPKQLIRMDIKICTNHRMNFSFI